jgi:hypothetical protein
MLDLLKDFLTAREPGCGYFGGAEGALRFLVLLLLPLICAGGWWILS